MSDDYDFVSLGSIKLKRKDNNESGVKNKKKKKKTTSLNENNSSEIQQPSASTNDGNETKLEQNLTNSAESNVANDNNQDHQQSAWMTEAERKFLAQQEKRQLIRVMAKASKTHKQRVEEFNSNLEKLSEHYDIPKVSWTK